MGLASSRSSRVRVRLDQGVVSAVYGVHAVVVRRCVLC